MVETTEISDIMLKDHSKIVKLLHDAESQLGKDKKNLKEPFNKLKWELERHIFIEEKVIFIEYAPKEKVDDEVEEDVEEVSEYNVYAMVPDLIKAHNELLKKVGILEKNLAIDKKIDFENLRKLLLDHKHFEEQEFYPKLDKTLDSAQKKNIVDKMHTEIFK